MPDHDGGYKSLFAHRRMVEDLLRGFVQQPWIQELDFTTLERCEGSYVSEKYRRYEQDMVWRVRWRRLSSPAEPAEPPETRWLFVYLLLEFQSQVEPFMALRVLTYLSLFYQDLARRQELTPSGKLPPVLPLVLYNGSRKWSAPRDVAELIEEMAPELSAHRPSLRYLLLDEGAYPRSELTRSDNLAAALFRLERSRDEHEVNAVVDHLAAKLTSPNDRGLRRAFGTWVTEILTDARFPETPETSVLEESRDMLRERVLEWTQEWERRGLNKGLEEGLRSGEQRILRRQLEHKFGPLDAATQRRIEEADTRQLAEWSKNLLSAATLEEALGS